MRMSPNNKELVPTDGISLLFMLPVTQTHHPVSTLTSAPAAGTAKTSTRE